MRLTANELTELSVLAVKESHTAEDSARFDELTAKRKAPEVNMKEALPAIEDNAVKLLLSLSDMVMHHAQLIGGMDHAALTDMVKHRAALVAELKVAESKA